MMFAVNRIYNDPWYNEIDIIAQCESKTDDGKNEEAKKNI